MFNVVATLTFFHKYTESLDLLTTDFKLLDKWAKHSLERFTTVVWQPEGKLAANPQIFEQLSTQ